MKWIVAEVNGVDLRMNVKPARSRGRLLSSVAGKCLASSVAKGLQGEVRAQACFLSGASTALQGFILDTDI